MEDRGPGCDLCHFPVTYVPPYEDELSPMAKEQYKILVWWRKCGNCAFGLYNTVLLVVAAALGWVFIWEAEWLVLLFALYGTILALLYVFEATGNANLGTGSAHAYMTGMCLCSLGFLWWLFIGNIPPMWAFVVGVGSAIVSITAWSWYINAFTKEHLEQCVEGAEKASSSLVLYAAFEIPPVEWRQASLGGKFNMFVFKSRFMWIANVALVYSTYVSDILVEAMLIKEQTAPSWVIWVNGLCIGVDLPAFLLKFNIADELQNYEQRIFICMLTLLTEGIELILNCMYTDDVPLMVFSAMTSVVGILKGCARGAPYCAGKRGQSEAVRRKHEVTVKRNAPVIDANVL